MEAVVGVVSGVVSGVSGVVGVTSRWWNYMLEQQLEDQIGDLRDSMGQLTTQRNSVMSRVATEEAGQLRKRTPTVDAWLKRFDDLEKDVTDVLQEGSKLLERFCICVWCPWNCWTNQKFGKKVMSRIARVSELIRRGEFQDVTERLTPTQVQGMPEDAYIVGLDSAFDTAWSFLQQDGVGIVGLHGLGGVGKTTLLKKINNMFLTRSYGFDFVIWALVSKEINMERVQKDIGGRLGIKWEDGADMNSRAQDIFNTLRSKTFLLLLDDIWKRLELTMIGIPTPSSKNKSKIIFTTRSEIVCGDMEANEKIRVECLNESQAWSLFQNKAGVLSNDPEIQPLAETVAKECGGLPLDLIVIGRTMAYKKTVREWKDAITTLQKHAENFRGMDKVFSILKYSYDELEDDSIRSCFLFCSLYPEDYNIYIEELVDQWIVKGYIDVFYEREEAINIGHRIIGILKALSLLESGDGPQVKLHDVIRDMAHWIKKDKIVIADVGFSESDRTEKLKSAQSITVSTDAGVKWLGDKPDCPNVTTLFLIVPDSGGLSIHDDFFLLMPALQFVHIIHISNIPTSIFKLVFLEYLCIAHSTNERFFTIPCEMKNMTRLKYFRLFRTNCRIPKGVLGHLSNLRHVGLNILSDDEELVDEMETHIQDLGCLNQLISIGIKITKVKHLELILNNQRLMHYTRFLLVNEFERADRKIIKLALSPLLSSSSSRLSLGYMKRLQVLSIEDCHEMDELLLSCSPDDTQTPLFQSLEEMRLRHLPRLVVTWDIRNLHSQCFRNLHSILILVCHSLGNITWLRLAPNLKDLDVQGCDSLEEIISDASEACEEITFSKLRELKLKSLPNLKLVCANVLPFPSLERITVEYCPGLRRLPLKPNNSPNNKLRSIKGSQEWWNNLEWETDTIKSAFAQFYMEA